MRNASGEQEASEVKTSGSEKKKPNRNTSNKIFGTTLFFLKCVTRMFHVVVDYWFLFCSSCCLRRLVLLDIYFLFE